ncbi:hypothetical protein PC129_g11726 [Phytophthora cactorum]|uniref:Uncharacterized protein n=1 Tax=Phytophthora cactorum TaxID=29920 RepID=A0A329RY97_9STRA|nr:hypothetical protein Pcac1_g17732 [Phytophthora cactorum]KAG2823656.1 hypothetical protein PC111_g10131 [Phytophthora cactorum]KAG2860597.1 hypothetical protein PC113_g7920 [Phytophthora cactorum]KAG2915470.1 hypothetical protein PC114_g7819 [Phytophthora cactorum]KAG2930204.1 hypothetical protein PC115_g6628 [Phytophthora cactorum]
MSARGSCVGVDKESTRHTGGVLGAGDNVEAGVGPHGDADAGVAAGAVLKLV